MSVSSNPPYPVFTDPTSQGAMVVSDRGVYIRVDSSTKDYQTSGSTVSVITGPRPPSPQRIVPIFLGSSNSDLDVVTLREELLSSIMKARETEELIHQIRGLTGEFPFEIEDFLRAHVQLIPYVNYIFSTVRGRMVVTGGAPFKFVVNKWTDLEAPDTESLELEVRIAVQDYGVLLGIWESLGREIYKQIPPEISEKLILTFDLL